MKVYWLPAKQTEKLSTLQSSTEVRFNARTVSLALVTGTAAAKTNQGVLVSRFAFFTDPVQSKVVIRFHGMSTSSINSTMRILTTSLQLRRSFPTEHCVTSPPA